MYQAQTHGVRVTAAPSFMDAESSHAQGRYFWAYAIEIVNLSTQTVQLMTRHWFITDGRGEVHEVRGEGVVGKQPVLRPGESVAGFVEACVRRAVEFRCVQMRFHERGQAAWEHYQRTGLSVPVGEVLTRLQAKLDVRREELGE